MDRRRPDRHRLLRSTGTAAVALALTAAGTAAAAAAPDDAAASATAQSYVALGDSFSSGTGTRASTDSCYRSPYGFPVLIAQGRGLDLDYQACSGATTADVRANQLGALSADTDYVTITIGGNDLDFAGVITQCALPGWLSDCQGRINRSLGLLRTSMPARYDSLFGEIAARAPEADVVVGSYPRLFNGQDCNLATFFSAAEMRSLNSATDELAGTIERRADAADFRYVDPRPAFTGHAVCDRVEWVNGLSLPVVESFHPNRAGNVAYAEVFWPGSTTAAAGARTMSTGPASAPVDDVRARAEAVLAMDLTSRENLAAARAAGVPAGELLRLVRQLRSSDTATVEQALEGLQRLDEQHSTD